MSEKYNYHIVLQKEDVAAGRSSHAQLLQMISPDSDVLECGPAYGVMTRYMKEVLHCRVQIIEIDQEGYAAALQYAVGGVCADIEDNAWMDQFEEGRFDYILYADILEHLRNPQAILVKMKRFLKPDGSILLSVPNIAHGDIIMNLLCDQFNYTPLGLLDNTHIHFFTYKSLRKMAIDAGYFVSYEHAMRKRLFKTEQGKFLPETERADLISALSGHLTADIVEFICRLTLTKTELKSDIMNPSDYSAPYEKQANFYFDCGYGFSAKMMKICCGQISDNGYIVFDVLLPEKCIAVRYDPVEGYPCVVQGSRASCDGICLEIIPLNGVLLGDLAIFQSRDPQMLVKVPAGSRILHIEASIIALSSEKRVGSLKTAMGIFREAQRLLKEKEAVIAETRQEIKEKEHLFQTELNQLKCFVMLKEARIEEQNDLLRIAQENYTSAEQQLKSIQKELVRCKEDYQKAAAQIEHFSAREMELQEAYNQISNSFFWRSTKPLRWILARTKDLFSNILL